VAVARRALGWSARRALPALLLALAGCSSTPPLARPAPPVPAPPAPLPDASFDWHGLIVAPFGSERQSFKESLHEVLLFRDDQESAAKTDALDCYSTDGAPPRLVGRAADHLFLCFRNDRLNRIEALVSLPTEAAAELFARFCAAARRQTGPVAEAAPQCEGQDRAAAFRARLDAGAEPGESDLSVVVNAAEAAD
jgi:hypothetical protein